MRIKPQTQKVFFAFFLHHSFLLPDIRRKSKVITIHRFSFRNISKGVNLNNNQRPVGATLSHFLFPSSLLSTLPAHLLTLPAHLSTLPAYLSIQSFHFQTMSSFPEAALAAGFNPLHQTYISNSTAENLELYRPGGFHPVYLDNVIQGRYKLVHKLGFGAFSTVWLAIDLQTDFENGGGQEQSSAVNRYRHYHLVSIKIVAASETGQSAENSILAYLQSKKSAVNADPNSNTDVYSAGSKFVLDIDSQFVLDGPNGLHQVIVSEFVGPSISAALEDLDSGSLSLRAALRLASQTVRGVAFLHSCGVAHGDLHLGNLLLHHPSFASWTQNDIDRYLGQPETFPIHRHDGAERGPYAPHYQVAAVNHVGVLPLLHLDDEDAEDLAVQVRIADFGESYIGRPRKRPGVPVAYAAPEVLCMPQDAAGHAADDVGLPADVWTLAVTIFEMLSGRMLFPGCGVDGDRVLREIRGALRGEDEEVDGAERKVVRMEERLKGLDRLGDKAGVAKRILSAMLKIRPEERITAAEIVEMLPPTWE